VADEGGGEKGTEVTSCSIKPLKEKDLIDNRGKDWW
jgi:hypothetical protein